MSAHTELFIKNCFQRTVYKDPEVMIWYTEFMWKRKMNMLLRPVP